MSTHNEVQTEALGKPAEKAASHLAYLDGIRGLAALYVVMHHIYFQVRPEGFRPALRLGTEWLRYGHLAVSVFIVLSGFCLMIPVARHGGIRGGVGSFFYRRSRRILPPYYVVLILSLAMIFWVPALNEPTGTSWDSALPALNLKAITSHALLVHNLSSDTFFKINPPMWSVATEFQIYFAFPLLLLPVFRRMGMTATIAVAFSVGFAPLILLHRGEGMSPWFLGLFALGMAAADYCFNSVGRVKSSTLLVACGATVVAFVGFNWMAHDWFHSQFYAMDIICGVGTSLFLVYYFQACREGDSWITGVWQPILESKFAVRLGMFSYSLYLLHMPMVAWTDCFVRSMGLAPDAHFALLLVFGLFVSLSSSYFLYLLVERHFVSSK